MNEDMKNAFLIGPTVYLRPLERSDAPLAQAWLLDPDIRAYIRQYRPLSLHREEEYIARLAESEHDIALVIMLRAGDQPIGVAGLNQLDVKNRHAQLGILIGVKELWSKGHGTEATRLLVKFAFDTLNLNRVWLHVYEDNVRGIRAYEKVGFKKEGLLRQDHFRDGKYIDTVVMGIVRDEWGSG
jgi:ribosomal-protein-alanine N-acetyltransferase